MSAPTPSSSASALSPFTSGGAPTEPRRTTKETHPNLPPGLILDAEGKVCKVCNSWQDWGKMKFSKKGGGGGGSASNTTSNSGRNTGDERSSGRREAGASPLAEMMAAVSASSSSRQSSSSSSSSSPTTTTSVSSTTDRTDCPADTITLGRATWTFLHTTAAYYPLTAPLSTQRQMLNLLSSISTLYPCTPCADDFKSDLAVNPPDVSGREGLSRWLCERHNEVNVKLGKERFDCKWENLNARWKDGPEDGRCD